MLIKKNNTRLKRFYKYLYVLLILVCVLRLMTTNLNNIENNETNKTQTIAKIPKTNELFGTDSELMQNYRGLSLFEVSDLDENSVVQKSNILKKLKYFLISMSKKDKYAFSRVTDLIDRVDNTAKRLINVCKLLLYRIKKNHFFSMMVQKLHIVSPRVRALIDVIKQDLALSIFARFPQQEAGLLTKLVLSYNSNEFFDLKPQVEKAGLSHIFSVSGMHISIYFALSFGFFNYFFNKKCANLLAMSLCILFSILLGFRISLIRALVMSCFSVLSTFLSVQYSSNRSLAVLCLVFFVFFTDKIYDLSFQLSFLATAAIIGTVPLLKVLPHQFLSAVGLHDYAHMRLSVGKILGLPGYILESLILSISVALALMPLLLFHFGVFYPVQIFSTVATGWLLVPILVLSFSFLFFSSLHFPLLAYVCSIPLHLLILILKTIINFISIYSFPVYVKDIKFEFVLLSALAYFCLLRILKKELSI